MSELRVASLTMPTAPLGPENPLPPLFAAADAHQVQDTGDADEEMRLNAAYGRVSSVMPYLLQDGYDRVRSPVDHSVAVLGNDRLTATFLLGAGGRLWSLVDQASGRELLHRNSVFQPANLALRNAWFAGGVEWNIGTIGHTPMTCEPMHAARVQLADGTPMLRMYEFERLREVVYQVDAWLPDGSPVLLVHGRIRNPADVEIPMYWWSNVAVPESDDVRVLAPADAAWRFGADRKLRGVSLPEVDAVERSYPARASDAADYFFALGDERRWVAALDGSGRGLVQTSTPQLRGRKLFVWGRGAGGRHWQEWLSGPRQRYLEIQAGLARTQLEHLAMPARTAWSWVEAYGPLQAEPEAVHSRDWRVAREAAAAAVDRLVPSELLDEALALATAYADTPPAERLHAGSGWGALERHLRERDGDRSLKLPGTPFPDDSLGRPQQAWLELLRDGRMTPDGPGAAPLSYQVSPRWSPALEGADGWLPALHLGVLLAHAGDVAGARGAWARSLEMEPTAWAWRNLAALSAASGDLPLALEHYWRAVALRGDLAPLTLELLTALLATGRGAEALEVIGAAPPELRSRGRFRWVEARAALVTGDLDRVARVLDGGIVVADLREGELSLDQLWFDYQAARLAREEQRPVDDELRARVRATVPVPPDLDFRMSVEAAPG